MRIPPLRWIAIAAPCFVVPGLLGACTPEFNGRFPEFASRIGDLGNTAALVLGLTYLIVRAVRTGRGPSWRTIVATMGIETGLYLMIKGATWHLAHRFPRPSGRDGGFPSGHTAAHVCLAMLLAESSPALAPLWYLWAGVMAWSRVAAGSHYAYQVLAGALLGGIVGGCVLGIARQRAPSSVAPSTAPGLP